MNLIQFFTREEPIAGLEVNEDFLRLSLLKLTKENKIKIEFLLEEPLNKNVISNGLIIDEKSLIFALKNLFKKCNNAIRYIILSLPNQDVYCKLFSFPKTVVEEKISETMKLIAEFKLPVSLDEVYIDWEKVESKNKNEVLLATIPKKIVDNYLKIFSEANINVVAVEFNALSFSRIISLKKDNTYLIKIPTRENIEIFIIKNGILRFGRILPKKFFFEEKFLNDEIKKIIEFYESETDEPVVRILEKKDLKIAKIFNQSETKDNKWMVCLGAAIRGLLPRAEDTLISLMEIGTEKAYEHQKAIIFAKLMQKIVIGLSLFFTLIFLGSWILLLTLQSSFAQRLQNISITQTNLEAVELENKARNFNALVSQSTQLLKTLPRWGSVIEEIKKTIPTGITITSFSLPSPEGTMTINGFAQNRSQLNLLKKSFNESTIFTEINLPLTNLEQKENISFYLTFRLKNPVDLYR